MFLDAIGQINLLGVGASFIVSFFFGGLWFGVVMAKPYRVALGRESLPVEKMKLIYILGPAVCNFIAVATSAILIKVLNISSMGGAISFGLLIGIGYVLSTCMNIAINPNFPRPFFYTLINAPYFIGSSLMTSLLLVFL